MKTLLKNSLKLITISILFVSNILSASTIDAADSTFTLNPSSGYVKVGDEFTVDIMINATEGDILLARASLKFDPDFVQVVKAERNENIFCTWPSDEQTVDNEDGKIILTGFCQSGNDTLYQTVGSADVFGRITFEVLKAGDVKIDWEYTGADVEGKSAIVKDGSPSQNVLDSKPESANFVAAQGNGTGTTTPTTPVKTYPRTGIFNTESIVAGIGVFLGSIMIFAGGAILVSLNRKMIKKKYKTLVTYE